MKLKVTRDTPNQRIDILRPLQKIAGLDGEMMYEVHALDGAIVITKATKTAMDTVKLITALTNLATDTIMDLKAACGQCDSCGYCAHIDLEDEQIRLPSHVLEEAGLPSNYKFTGTVDDDGSITLRPAGYDYDLTDVPPEMLDMMRKAGVCIHELEDLLIGDGIISTGDTPKDDDDF